MAMLQASPPMISIVDSKDDSRMTFVVIDNCKVEIRKTELKDFDAVLAKVDKVCKLNLQRDEK
jgi:hypothetical protein